MEVVATAVPVGDELPADLSEAISPLALLDDDALWRAARTYLPAEAATRMENLHFKRQREGLTETEAQILASLVRQYERAMLVVGLTPVGRATVVALNLNRPSLVKARQAWCSVGWHPPKD